jgi:hypothetical protein
MTVDEMRAIPAASADQLEWEAYYRSRNADVGDAPDPYHAELKRQRRRDRLMMVVFAAFVVAAAAAFIVLDAR